MVNPVSYHVGQFEQIKCEVCWHDYQENDAIVQLACKHILHKNCLNEDQVRCVIPICAKRIEGKEYNVMRSNLTSEINKIREVLSKLSPHLIVFGGFGSFEDKEESKNLLFPEVRTDLVIGVNMDGEFQLLEFLYCGSSLPSVVKATIKEIKKDLETLQKKQKDCFPEIVNRHSQYLIQCLEKYNSNPRLALLQETFFEDFKMHIQTIQKLSEKKLIDEDLADYLNKVINKVLADNKTEKIFEGREKVFATRVDNLLDNNSFIKNCLFLSSLSSRQKEIVVKHSNHLKNLTHAPMILTLGIMSATLFGISIYQNYLR